MKSSIAVATLLATLALAGPVKRALVTEYETETVTVVVTVVGGHHKPTGSWGAVSVKPSTTSTSLTTSTVHSVQSKPPPAASVPIKPSPTSTAAAVSSTPSTSGQSTNDGNVNLSAYASAVLVQHNIHRENHTVPALVWDDYLTSVAKQHAETCVYQHSRAFGDGNYGQNIGAGYPDAAVPKMVTNDMYNGEINHYPGYGIEPDMSHFEVWGHFSQIVWKDTKSVGCYTAKCNSLGNVGGNVPPYFTVCNYKPSGNYGGQYGKNVLAPLHEKTVIVQ